MNASRRISDIEGLIPEPLADIAPLRIRFSRLVSIQWETYVPSALSGFPLAATEAQSQKARFIGEMYARACYSMLLLSASGPRQVRFPMRASAALPLSRPVAIALGGRLISGLSQLLPASLHCRLLLTSALMGALDVMLDDTAARGEDAVLRIASLVTSNPPEELTIARLIPQIRAGESGPQSRYWESAVVPAVRKYCLAEAHAVSGIQDPEGMGHRRAGIDAAIQGMWYVLGDTVVAKPEAASWNREQKWMADTSLLMQMVDDWVDQDEDRGARITPVVTGAWTVGGAEQLYGKTVVDLQEMLAANGIRNRVLQELFLDLYNDYLHAALEAMRSGVAA